MTGGGYQGEHSNRQTADLAPSRCRPRVPGLRGAGARAGAYARAMPGRLILCAGPIGNLGDAPARLAEELAGADMVYAEDTRRSGVLLRHLGVRRPLRSYFAGNEEQRAMEMRERLDAGETVALVTDAGTPSISDPGLSAVRAALDAGADVSVIPGPSAVTAALAVSGLPADRFVFEGFLPRSGGRRRDRLGELAAEHRTIVLFCAPGRLGGDLADLSASLGTGRRCAVCRELTKLHEEVWRGTLGEAASHWADGGRGEVTVVVEGGTPAVADVDTAAADVERLIADGVPLSDAVRSVAENTGVRRRTLYERAIRRSGA